MRVAGPGAHHFRSVPGSVLVGDPRVSGGSGAEEFVQREQVRALCVR
jgi:hypothetical protein